MKCKDCKKGIVFWAGNHHFTVKCQKYGIEADTTNADRQCIEEDNDVLWRAGWEKGERWDG